MEAKKSLGQHFLIDNGVLNRIKDELKGSYRIVEIGGGRGALTQKLAELGVPLSVVELDSMLYDFLNRQFENNSSVTIINQDASNYILSEKAAVVGNLPYNVSKKIIKNMVMQKDKIDKMVFMVQKEVADSIVALPNTKEYSKFSVLVQFFFKTKKLFNVGRNAFNPPPKIESSVVRFEPYETNLLDIDIDYGFFRFLNVLFQFPRKTVRNNIKPSLKGNEKKIEHFLTKRPKELLIEEMYHLYREVKV